VQEKSISATQEGAISMKKLALLAGITLLIVGCASGADIKKMYSGAQRPDSQIAKIRVPGDLDVVRIDDRTLTYLYSGEPVEVQLLPGRHAITLRYYEIWEVKNDLTKVISDPVSKTLTVSAGRSYEVEHVRPASLQSAESYAPNFDFIIREVGSPVNVATDWSAGNVSGLPNQTGNGSAEGSPLARLQYWWGQASDHEREDFRGWIKAPQ
jgi:uncharacterized protein YccT (UPF0319 family)